jgi:16S rRNA (cytosine1402-N4)-methyltransferase
MPAGVVVDCTVGRGGHTLAIASRLGPDARVIALDADPANLDFARDRITRASPLCPVECVNANFNDLSDVLDERAISTVDFVLADLGISTNQLLDPSYGLSFQNDGPLDMRIDPTLPLSAAEVVNRTPEKNLADLIYELADERFSRRIARRIVEARAIQPITTTSELARIVRSACPWKKGSVYGRREPIDPATRTFLALRMHVNRETSHLTRLIEQASARLSPGGRLAVISFQSTEDRIVKHAMRGLAQTARALEAFETLTKRPIEPTDAETARNPRARSAKMRVLRRTGCAS